MGGAWRAVVRLMSAALLVAAGIAPVRAAPRAPLVLAAASMQEALSDAADDWARRGHVRPVVSFAASSALARQTAAGAHADLFLSADQDWMDDVQRRGLLVAGTRGDVARNGLVVVGGAGVPLLSDMRGPTLARVLGAGPLAMADPDSVPAGRYGRIALTRLGAWPAVAPRVVRAENVRAALALVARGGARYGIVYATDARASREVRVAGVFPARSHPPIVYPLARLKNGDSPQEAEEFRRFLLSPAGRAILARRGFAVS